LLQLKGREFALKKITERESTLTTSGIKEIQISVPIPAHMTRGFKFANDGGYYKTKSKPEV
jgi:hypothetical protein